MVGTTPYALSVPPLFLWLGGSSLGGGSKCSGASPQGLLEE